MENVAAIRVFHSHIQSFFQHSIGTWTLDPCKWVIMQFNIGLGTIINRFTETHTQSIRMRIKTNFVLLRQQVVKVLNDTPQKI